MLVIVQGQGKADLATGYELDIIASAVVGGASLCGGRGLRAGGRARHAHLRRVAQRVAADPRGHLLRPADRGRGRHRHRGDGPAHGQAGQDERRTHATWRQQAGATVVLAVVARPGVHGRRRARPRPRRGASPAAKKYRFAVIPKSLDLPVFNYAQVGRRARGEGARQRRDPLARRRRRPTSSGRRRSSSRSSPRAWTASPSRRSTATS